MRILPEAQRANPQLWNGRVLLGRHPVFAGSHLTAGYFETDFASFLAWRDWGFPDRDVFNGFGMGALRCADGAFVLGEMGQHTSNAGRIYFPSGTPDLDDVRDGALDISGSVARELEEETGLVPGEYRERGGLALRLHRPGAGDDPAVACRYVGRGLARPDRGQSRLAAIARIVGASIWCAERAISTTRTGLSPGEYRARRTGTACTPARRWR